MRTLQNNNCKNKYIKESGLYFIMPTHYESLNVSQDATEEDIKKSYRKLSLKYHPDRNGGNQEFTEKYKEINEAYEILGDKQKREQYDMELKFGMGGGMGGMDNMHDINNIFNMMFGGGFPGAGGFHAAGGFPGGEGIHIFHGGPGGFRGAEHIFAQMNKPPPIIKHVKITLEQAYHGADINIDYERSVFHEDKGLVTQFENMTIHIPAGIEENEVMIFRGQGHMHREDVCGDIKVTFSITNDTIFKRHGMDLIYHKRLSLKEALCGFSFEISHLNGKTLNMNNLTNHAIIKPNYKKVVPGLGMVKNNVTGNLIIEIFIDFPESLPKEKIELLRDIL